MDFQITASNVLMLVALAIPGYILVKTKVLKPDVIPKLVIILLYVNQPFLSLYSFQQAVYSPELALNLLYVFLISTFAQLLMMGLCYLSFFKKFDDARYRVCTFASACGNVGFFGVPILQALLPEYPEAVMYSAVYIVSMNLIGWTLGMFLLSGDKKYVSFKNFALNPSTLTMIVALPLFFCSVQLPDIVMEGVTYLGRNMAPPMAMFILGMRFACASMKEVFLEWRQYIAVVLKLVIFPLVCLLILIPMPIASEVKAALYIMSAMPPATVILNFSELLGTAPKTAANIVLLGSIMSIITFPVLMLLL